MQLLEFIKNNSEWKEILQMPPYFMEIQKLGNFYHFCAPTNSNYWLCREANGVVICDIAGEFVVTCWPFSTPPSMRLAEQVGQLDSSRCTRLVDGFWVFLWNDEGNWRLSTIGSLNAYDIKIENTNIGMLVEKAVGPINELAANLSPIYTYMFQLTAPQIQFAIDYGRDPHLWYFCKRNLETGEIDFNVPLLPSLCNVVERFDTPPKNDYMQWLFDGQTYIEKPNSALLEARKWRGNHVLDTDRVIQIWQNDAINEFIAKVGLVDFINPIVEKLEALVTEVEDIYARLLEENGDNKTNFIADAYKYQTYASSAMIHLYNKECNSIRNFYKSIDSKYLVPIIEDAHYGIRKRA